MANKKKLIVLIGGPGVGKGTFAKMLMDMHSYNYIGVGALLRALPSDSNIHKIISDGNLVPDDVLFKLLMANLKDDTDILLDGFPRNVSQAEILAGMMKRAGVTLRCALLLDVPDDIVVRRISGRRVCSACGAGFNVDSMPPKSPGLCDACGATLITRKDDTPETVRHRLEVYAAQTFPLIEYYRSAGQLITIDGSGDDLAWKTAAALEKIRG